MSSGELSYLATGLVLLCLYLMCEMRSCIFFINAIYIKTYQNTYAITNGNLCSLLSYEPGHAKTCLRAYADSEGPDKPAHPRSLIRAFIVR